MTEPKYSIIIPVYNAEKYIRRCLDSIMSQTYRDFEVVIVDDGSTDASKDIYISYTEDSRVSYFHQSNSGVSSARNKGIHEAKGEYILFVDADDYISDHLLQIINESCKDQDIIVFQFTVDHYGDKTKIKQELSRFLNDPLDFSMFYKNSEGITDNGFFHDKSMAVYCWRAAYKHSFLQKNNIKFNELLKTGEDRIFLYDVLLNKPIVSTLSDEYGYFHSIHGTDSLIGSKDLKQYKPTLFQDQLNMFKEEMRAIERNNYLSASSIESIKQFRANRIRSSVVLNEFKYNQENATKTMQSYFKNDLFKYAYGFKSFLYVLKKRRIKEIIQFLLVRFRCYGLLLNYYK